MPELPNLPLTPLRGEFIDALSAGVSLLLEAEPGAGKSTLAPLWALEWVAPGQQVWLIQPRVLSAVALAGRLAELDDSEVGARVGYQVPFDRAESESTQLLLMTPGVFLQRLLADPELESVAVVMLDEIHERSVNQDTAWAMVQETAMLREDLKLVLMSATADKGLRTQVDHSLYSPGRCFPVNVGYCPAQQVRGQTESLEQQVLRALANIADWHTQTVLVFLPGWREIERCQQALEQQGKAARVFSLHSRVARAEQVAALDPTSGPRVILATNIAETSLTIVDVTLVVDSGLAREPDYEQRTGVTRLKTRRISAASAEQRRGRAGRVQAGQCIRLWAESEPLAPQTLPEIRRTDYVPLALRLAHWGTPVAQLPWLEAPGPLAMQHAQAQLRRWELLNKDNNITAAGRRVAELGTHPRIAAILLHAQQNLPEQSWLALLALALHFDLPPGSDLSVWLQEAQRQLTREKRWQLLLARWNRVLGLKLKPEAQVSRLPAALLATMARVFADRIGRATSPGQYRLNTGVTVSLACSADWAMVLHLSSRGKTLLGVGLDIALDDSQIHSLAEIETAIEPAGAGTRRRWVETRRYRMGGQVVDEVRQTLSPEQVPYAIVEFVRQRGLPSIPWPAAALTLLLRARLAQSFGLLDLPDLSESALTERLEQWLQAFLDGASQLEALPLAEALTFYLGFESVAQLDTLLPEVMTLPSGRKVAVNYRGEVETAALVSGAELPEPVISGKLQEFFGAATFTLPSCTVPLTIELLSPAARPLAITRDLAYFWAEVYPQVRKEMRGRYAKHPWPENPLEHVATGFTKKRLES
ncbi:ATP-dependent helicase HrpB [Gilvimarinus sp. DA14]|uniref:ATP-dependent helicase HrpB n=1 Tax=Gilvimarinus sp. DA14 TaxID=2956798 RepID=UPI0020B693DE|nr:ATP-dependent helicase HrpB [Gilvimarinus sp. DA14]UTF61077.1 ATP-dependent helicase HrpB [Gilvimarinus sp. DA14]